MRFLLLMLFPVFAAFGQQSETGGSALLSGGIEVKFGVAYSPVSLDSLNAAFAGLEEELGFRPWGKSALPYFASMEVRYPLFPNQSVIVEVGGGIVSRVHEEDRSWTSIWRGGAGYRFQFLEAPVGVSLQGTAGMVWASFSRTYNDKEAVINAASNSWYVSAAGTGSLRLTSWSSLELSAGYTFVNAFTTTTPDSRVDLKAPVAGIGLVFDLR